MTSVPRTTITRRDGGLGSLLASAAGRLAVVGVAASGPFTPQVFTSQGDLVATYTSGPLVDAAAYVLAWAGWVLVQRAANGTTGARGNVARSGLGAAAGGVTAGGGNTSTAVPTLGGTVTRAWPVVIRVTAGGANFAAGTARFQWSIDGALTWSAAAAPAAGPIPLGDTGITLAWTDGTFVNTDSWTGSSVPGAQRGTATLAVTGDPNDAYEARVQVLRDGTNLAAATATYRLSLDGGDTWGPETAMPVSGVVTPAGTGLTLTFANGAGPTSFREGDAFTFDTTAPTYTSQGMADAYAAVDQSEDDVEGILFTGAFDAALCTSLEALCAASETQLRYRITIVGVRARTGAESRAEWENAIRTDFATWQGLHVVVCAGHTEVIVPTTQRQLRRSASLAVAGRMAAVSLSEDLAWVERGPLPGVVSVDYDGADNPSLNDFGFTTLRRRRSRTARGVYVVNPHTGAADTSDFKLLQYLRVWNEAARTLAAAMERHQSRKLVTVPKPLPVPTPPIYQGRTPGAIDDREAAAIEADVEGKLAAVLLEGPVQHVTAVTARINRTVDIVATRTLPVSLSLGPMSYAKLISAEIGFSLPQQPNGGA